jgi:DNA modification methylase
MQQSMNTAMNGVQYGLKSTYQFREEKNKAFWLMQGDSCIEIDRLADNSVDLMVFSPPFSSLFTYSNYIHDMGNNASHDEFFEQYAYLLAKLYSKLKPGRIMACHTKDLGVYKNASGYTGLYNFTGKHHDAVEAAGFRYHSKITIWTDPVLEMQRTKTQRLLYKQLTTDSTYTGVGMPEYVTLFRKWDGSEEAWEPVTNLTRQNFPLDIWQKWASPVWMDIKRTDVLNNYKSATDLGDEKHIAPLQLEVVHRIVNMWSNKGETVFTPFAGIGTELYVSLLNGRKPIGIELKDSYYDTALANCRAALESQSQLSIW